MVEGVGFEPTKAEPSDLQSDPFDHSGTPPEKRARHLALPKKRCQPEFIPNSFRKPINYQVLLKL